MVKNEVKHRHRSYQIIIELKIELEIVLFSHSKETYNDSANVPLFVLLMLRHFWFDLIC